MRKLALPAIACILSFLLISGLVAHYRLHIKSASAQTATNNVVLYHDQLNQDFTNWSWGSQVDFNERSTINQGTSAIGFQPSAWGGLYLHTEKAIDTSSYESLSFALFATQQNQRFSVILYDANNQPIGTPFPLPQGQPNTWQQVTLPLADLQASATLVKGFALQEISGQNQTKVYLDEIVLKSKNQPLQTADQSPAIVYGDKLATGFENWSWDSTVNFEQENPTYSGNTSIAFTAHQPWAGLYLHTSKSIDTTPYAFLQFAVYATQPNQKFAIVLHDSHYNILGNPVLLDSYGILPAKVWKLYSIPLSDLHAVNGQVSGVVLQEAKGQAQPVIYVDSIAFTNSQKTMTTAVSPTPTATSTPEITATPTPTPAPVVKKFTTLPPGSTLPSSQECARQVRRSAFEPRPENYTANHTTGVPANFPGIDGATPEGNNALKGRIDGNFTGTTDEIIQWGACKWGFDEDIVRAVAAQESWWRQSTKGDFNGSDYESYGLLQVRRTSHVGTYPMSEQSTPFNVDFALAWRRACYEGYFTWIPSSAKGDEWGCIGLWYSGKWYDGDINTPYSGAKWYIGKVKQYLAEKPWLKSDF